MTIKPPPTDVNRADHWDARYEAGTARWDRAAPASALTQLLDDLRAKDAPAGRVLVPGAGYGHDALAWAGAGWDVVAVDFAPLAIAGLRERAADANVEVQALEADIFALPRDLDGAFDAVWEQTCLCAIDPARRPEYVEAMHAVLRPHGRLYALLWNHGNGGGPPHDLPPAVGKAVFEGRFEVLDERAVEGSSRKGEYLLTLARA